MYFVKSLIWHNIRRHARYIKNIESLFLFMIILQIFVSILY